MEGLRSELEVLGQALIALVLGGIIGWERQAAGKWAGLRTHMLVCFASMLFVRVGEFLILDAQEWVRPDSLRLDPVRLVEAIVTGIAFIGAGTVIFDRQRSVAQGLTTAASLLAVAPIGVAVAVHRYFLAAGATLIVLIVLRGVSRLEQRGFGPATVPQPPEANRKEDNKTRT
ncbi:MAG: MgtC/SapB family protein [Verrucomicrobiota bacterium]